MGEERFDREGAVRSGSGRQAAAAQAGVDASEAVSQGACEAGAEAARPLTRDQEAALVRRAVALGAGDALITTVAWGATVEASLEFLTPAEVRLVADNAVAVLVAAERELERRRGSRLH